MRAAIDTAPQCALHQLRAFVSAHIEIIQGEGWHYHQVWIREWDKLSYEARQRLQPSIIEYRNLLNTLLAVLAREGHLRSDPEMFRHLLLPALNWTPAWTKFHDEPTRALLAEQICAATLNMPLTEFQTLIGRTVPSATSHRSR